MRARRTLGPATMLATGALLGWLSASGRLQSLTHAESTSRPPAEVATSKQPCCDGNERGVLFVKAHIPAAAALPLQAAQPAGGRKPNILVIWGDDIGQSNVSAYS